MHAARRWLPPRGFKHHGVRDRDRACVRETVPKAGPRLLEPMMKVELVTPEDYLGSVIGDLISRRGRVQGLDGRSKAQVISAIVPLARMFGYDPALKQETLSRATWSMTFSHYEQVPPALRRL